MTGGEWRITASGATATALASLALIPAYQGQGWLWPGIASIGLVAAVGFGLRLLGTPKLLIPLGQLAALLWAFILVYARENLRWKFLPTGDSVQEFRDQLSAGFEIIVRYAAPVPSDPELVIVTALGVGVVAIAVDTAAATFRLVPWAGLPLLMLYSIPATTVVGGVSALAFIPAAVGYVVLLASEGRERLSQWGRVVGFADEVAGRSEGVQTSLLGQSGRRVGAAVIGLAAVVPALLPALPEGVIGRGGGGPGGSSQVVRVSNPMVDLRRDLRMPENFLIMTYRTNQPVDEYIRLVVLDEFDGDNWRQSERSVRRLPEGDLPDPPGLASSVDRTTFRAHFEIEPALQSSWLPLFYPAEQVDVEGRWSYDPATLDVLSRDKDRGTGGLTYSETGIVPEFDGRDLKQAPPPPGAIRERYTRLPDAIPQQVEELAKRITKDAESDFGRAAQLQEWFRQNFVYSLDVQPGHTGSALMRFIQDKRGYCEQFAATMAIMARELGIPARVAVGYMTGSPVNENTYEVRVQDAHAWPELYFGGFGWVRFEPTPAQQTDSPPDWTSISEPQDETSPSPQPTSDSTLDDTERGRSTPSVERTPGPDPTITSGGGGGGADVLLPLGIGAGILLVLATPGGLRLLVRHHRLSRRQPAQLAEACWRELATSVRNLGLPWDESTTPRAVGDRLATRMSVQAAEDLWVLVEAVERTRYAPAPGTDADVRAVTRHVVRGLAQRTRLRRRLLAVLVPPSFWRGIGHLGRPVTWLLDGVENVLGRITLRLKPRPRP